MSYFLAQSTPTSTPTPSPNYGWLEFMRDPLWQFIGVIVALIAIIITIYFSLRSRREKPIKRLSPVIITETPLVSIREEEELKGRLVVLFDKQPMQKPDISMLIIEFSNTGTEPIDDEDYSGPIRIECGENSEVLTANVTKTEPNDFDAKAEIDPTDPTKALLNPVLLNAGQSVTVKILVRKAAQVVGIYAHIKGVDVEKLISRRKEIDAIMRQVEERSGLERATSSLIMVEMSLIVFVFSLFLGLPELITFLLFTPFILLSIARLVHTWPWRKR